MSFINTHVCGVIVVRMSTYCKTRVFIDYMNMYLFFRFKMLWP